MNKQLLIQGGLYTLIGMLTPITTALASDMTLTTRSIVGLIMGGLVAGATALKAFMSTTFSDSGASDQPDKPPQAVKIEQPPGSTVKTTETKTESAPREHQKHPPI